MALLPACLLSGRGPGGQSLVLHVGLRARAQPGPRRRQRGRAGPRTLRVSSSSRATPTRVTPQERRKPPFNAGQGDVFFPAAKASPHTAGPPSGLAVAVGGAPGRAGRREPRAAGRGPALLFARILPRWRIVVDTTWVQFWNCGWVLPGPRHSGPGVVTAPQDTDTKVEPWGRGSRIRGRQGPRPSLLPAQAPGSWAGRGPRPSGSSRGEASTQHRPSPQAPRGELGSWAGARPQLGSSRRERGTWGHAPPPPRPQCPPSNNHSSEPRGCPARAWHGPGVP